MKRPSTSLTDYVESLVQQQIVEHVSLCLCCHMQKKTLQAILHYIKICKESFVSWHAPKLLDAIKFLFFSRMELLISTMTWKSIWMKRCWNGRLDHRTWHRLTSFCGDLLKTKSLFHHYLEIWCSYESGPEMNLLTIQETFWCEYRRKWSICRLTEGSNRFERIQKCKEKYLTHLFG